MIKANELRIGNWLLEAGEPSNIYHIERGSIYQYRINDIAYNRQTGCTVNGGDDRLQPIPLTPEILEKAGFKNINYGDENLFHKDGMNQWRLLFDPVEKAAFYKTDDYKELGHGIYLPTRIEYVHQLQNLYFTLTGEELPINFQT